jgi:hypothetical protein
MLEYHSIHRHLRYAKTQAIIRKQITDKLNTALNNSYVGLNAKIVINGLMTPGQLDDEQKLFQQGNLEFGDLYKRTSNF